MITPEQVELLAGPLIELYANMEADLLRNISAMVASGASASSQDLEWLLEKMSQTGALRRENIAVIARMSGKAEAEVERILYEAGYRSLDLAESIYADARAAGLTTYEAMPVTSSLRVQQILSASVSNAKNTLNLVNTTALASANTEFLKIINQVYLETSLGIYSYNDSVNRAVRQLADKGITGVEYQSAAGRITRTTPDVAVRRAILTSSAQTTGKLQVARAEEWGAELIEVSSHWDARPSHAVWQGKIYMLHGSSAEYANFADATGYGTGEGLCGYNCRHSFYPFWEGISEQRYHPYDLEENERRYNESQKQRAIERDIRKYKRRQIAAVDDAEARAAAAAVREKQAEMRKFIEETNRTRRRMREQVA